MKTQLLLLYQLQQKDTALDTLKRQFAALDPGKAEQAAYEAAKAAHAEAEADLHAASGSLRDTELEQKSVETKRVEYETKLYSGKVHVAKELQAMQEEVEMLTRQRGKLDEKILTLMDDLEACRTREAAAKRSIAVTATAYKARYATYKQSAETIRAQAQALAAQRAELVPQIPPSLLKRYDSLRASKGGLAIVALEDSNACGGCKMGLSSSLVKSVQEAHTLEVCDNCGRILCSAVS